MYKMEIEELLKYLEKLQKDAKNEFNSSASNYDTRLGYYRGQKNILDAIELFILDNFEKE